MCRILHEQNHDYYDGVAALGFDPAIVWVRNPKTVKLLPPQSHWESYKGGRKYPEEAVYPFPYIWEPWGTTERIGNSEFELQQYVIGFCGKIYPVLNFWKSAGPTYCYTLGEVDTFVESIHTKAEVEAYKSEHHRWFSHYGRLWREEYRRKKFAEFFEKCEKQKDKFIEMFRTNRCPVFVARYHNREFEITYHAANLKNFGFQRIFNPYMAFQEISMFYGNIAVPLRDIPTIDDKTMSESKGFDKFSFRKEPTKEEMKDYRATLISAGKETSQSSEIG